MGDCSSDDGGDEDDDIRLSDDVRSCMTSGNNGRELWAATINDVNNSNLQLLDSILELVDFILTEHCSLIHLMPDDTAAPGHVMADEMIGQIRNDGNVSDRICSHRSEKCDGSGGGGIINRESMMKSISRHLVVAYAMKAFPRCNHVGTELVCWPCLRCEFDLYKELSEIEQRNVILARFSSEMSRYGHANNDLLWGACSGLAGAMKDSLHVAEDYVLNLENYLSEEANQYCRQYGRLDLKGKVINKNDKLFAVNAFGRKLYRPLLHFGANETHHCGKKSR